MQSNSMLRNRFFVLCALLLLVTIAASRLGAQGSTATIVGTVTDSSGAAVAGASVQAKNTGTGIAQTVASDSQGRFRFSNLGIGDYEVQSSSTGFQTVVRKLTLTIGSEPVVDFSLPVGQSQQTVTVDSQVSLVETQSTAIGALVEGTQMRELPLNGRNYTQLLALEPGVTQIVAGAPAADIAFSEARIILSRFQDDLSEKSVDLFGPREENVQIGVEKRSCMPSPGCISDCCCVRSAFISTPTREQ